MTYEEARKKIEDIYNIASTKLKEIALLQTKISKKENEQKSIINLQNKLKNNGKN